MLIQRRTPPPLRNRPHDAVWFLDDGRGQPAYKSGSPLTAAMVNYQRSAGVRRDSGPGGGGAAPKGVHGFRAHFITAGVNMGLPIDTVAALVGHSKLAVTQGYVSNDMPRKVAVGELFRKARGLGDALETGTELAPTVVN